MSEFIDAIGDLLGTSVFSREKKVWKKTADITLTREAYNRNRQEFNFRNSVVYQVSPDCVFTAQDMPNNFFLNDRFDSNDEKIRIAEENMIRIKEEIKSKARKLKLAVSFALAFWSFAATAFAASSESVYEHVMRTGVLRCGYFEEVPFTNIDPNTNKKTGIAVELMETITSQTGLKIEWAQPVNFPTMAEDLKMGRYDAVCGGLFNSARAGRFDYTQAFIYVPIYGYVRKGDRRFENNLVAVNAPNIVLSTLDGEASSEVARRMYPRAKQLSLPQASEISQLLLSVADKKADISFVLPSVFAQFDKNNPRQLRKVENKDPFYVFSVSFAVRPGELELKNMLDFMIKQLIVSGEMDRIIDKYEETPGMFLRAAKPYR